MFPGNGEEATGRGCNLKARLGDRPDRQSREREVMFWSWQLMDRIVSKAEESCGRVSLGMGIKVLFRSLYI